MLYCFAHCVLNTQLHTLRRADQSTLLAPKVFEVLCYLIEHRERVVSKQELCDQVWNGFAISAATLESCIRAVRMSVGDSGQAQQIIQTHRGHGYRFVAAVDISPEASPGEASETPSPAWLPPEAFAQEQIQKVPGVQPCGTWQQTNPEDATFFTACGTRLRQPCSYVGHDVALPAVFCIVCGQPLAPLSPADRTAVSAVAPWRPDATQTPSRQGEGSAERKPVTVLCCT